MDKIKEGVVDETSNENIQQQEDIITEEESKENEIETVTNVPDLTIRFNLILFEIFIISEVNFLFSSKLLNRLQKFSNKIDVKYREWTEDNTLRDFFYINALVCFSLGLIIIFNIFIELKCSKGNSSNLFCKFYTNNVIGQVYNNMRNNND